MRLSVIADWLPTYGGAEHVIASFHRLWPEARIYTTVAQKNMVGPLSNADIRTQPVLQSLFTISRNHQWLLPFLPHAIERIDCSDSDVILSSSHAIGKGVIPPPTAVHVCYCHTPMRYAWEMERQYLDDFHLVGPLRRWVRGLLLRLRRWDLTTAKRVDVFIANSQETAKRIQRIYGRTSIVLPPSVEDIFFDVPLVPLSERNYFLAVGRLVPYKKFDLLIRFANTYKVPLKIVGSGQAEHFLRSIAGPTVEFLGHVSTEALPGIYSHAQALLFPQLEDAGVVPREAQATGTPVIAFGKGGALDAILPGVTGVFMKEQSIDALKNAVDTFASTVWNPQKIRQHATVFSRTYFESKLQKIVEDAYAQYHTNVSTIC